MGSATHDADPAQPEKQDEQAETEEQTAPEQEG